MFDVRDVFSAARCGVWCSLSLDLVITGKNYTCIFPSGN